MKFPKASTHAYGIQTLIQIIFFVIGVVKHDWFYLLAAFVVGPNLYRIVNYEGDE